MMRLDFTLTQLKYFLAVAQTRHFAKAAELCFVSQPTLSTAIKKLERQLGLQLFERGLRQDVMLTDAGQKLLIQTRKVLDEAEQLQMLGEQQGSCLEQKFTLGVIYSVAPYLLPRLVPQLHNSAEKLQLYIEENFTEVLREKLSNGEIDAAILALPFSETGTESHILYRENFVAVFPQKHPLSKIKKIKREDIPAEELLVLGPGHCFRDQVLQACPQCIGNETMNETFKGSSLETIVQMVASGAGVSILPERCAINHSDNPLLKISQLSEPTPYRDIALVWRGSSAKKEVIELISSLKLDN